MASGNSMLGTRSSTTSYSQLRSQYVATLGSSSSERTQSKSGSIALESFVQNRDAEKDGPERTKPQRETYGPAEDGRHDDDQWETEFVSISYSDVENVEQVEFQLLLKKESGWRRSCLHKGLISSIVFFLMLIVGVVMIQVFFPNEGTVAAGNDDNIRKCEEHLDTCIPLRALRSIGLFGFVAGMINWLFIELLFRKVYCVFGSGIIQKHYQEILDGLRSVIIDSIFDVHQLHMFFSEKDSKIRKMLKLETHVGGLLTSEASQTIIEEKIDDILNSPQGFILLRMGINKDKMKSYMLARINAFIADISPTIYRKLVVPGISDGEGLKSEISYILEPKIAQLMACDVNKIVAVMLRKHLSWLIIWGNVFGTLVGVANEIALLITLLLATGQ